MKFIKKDFNILLYLFFAALVLFSSEYIFLVNNTPEKLKSIKNSLTSQNLEKSFLTKAMDKKLPEPVLKKFTTKILYLYLDKSDKEASSDNCKPVCLSYQDSQNYLELFKQYDQQSEFSFVSNQQKAKLYFWMATFNIWNDTDNQLTKDYLDKSIDNHDQDDEAKKFRDDFNSMLSIGSDEKSQAILKGKLKHLDVVKTYEKLLLANAAWSLSGLENTPSDEKIELLQKAVDLNRWNEKYYMKLADIYTENSQTDEAKKTYEKCIENLGKDSTNCNSAMSAL